MNFNIPSNHNYFDGFGETLEEEEEDLWFLPGPIDDGPEDYPGRPQGLVSETTVLAEWKRAEANHAALLARTAGRLGALDDRLRRGPRGWQHRLALMETAELSWLSGDRIGVDRLALWRALRLAGPQDDANALACAGWAMRRLTGGAGPEAGLADFLDRRDPEHIAEDADRFIDRSESWAGLMRDASELHPITRACMGFHLWGLAGLGADGERMEAVVTAGRIAAGENFSGKIGTVFAPLAMGGAGGLRVGGSPAKRLSHWLNGMGSAILTATRQLDVIETWAAHAETEIACLSGRTPPALVALFVEWPLISAPMAETLTGASRAAVQRNLIRMEAQGLIQEITKQGRFRMWKATL